LITDLESGREQKLASRKLPEVLDYPAWSPDGRMTMKHHGEPRTITLESFEP